MIGWGTIVYGAVLSAIAAAIGLFAFARRRAPMTAIVAGVGCAFVAPIVWNAILRATHAERFFTDLPGRVFPISWQDTGSGIFTLALSTLVMAMVIPELPARRLAMVGGIAAIAALLVDVYLY